MKILRFLLIPLTFAGTAQSVWAQTTYWLPAIESTAKEQTYKYGEKLPDDVATWLVQKGKKVQRPTDSGERQFIEASVDWDTNGNSNPMGGGMLSFHKTDGYGYDWMPFSSSELKGNAAIATALDAAVVTNFGSWRAADLIVLVSQGDANPNVTLRVAIPEDDQIRARMRAIAESTVPGQFYPNDVQIPADLDAMRREILALGNLGRRDPDYRRNNKYANDLRGEYATTDKGRERIYHNNPNPPYFNDLVLNPKLNEACQFMAEYYARTNGNAQMPKGRKHDAPGARWQGAKMDTFGDRLAHFAPGVGSAGEGLAGAGPADSAPTTWMTSETHYRPWFNIDHDVKSMGIGVARTKAGWYFCKAGGTEPPMNSTPPATQSDPQVTQTIGAPAKQPSTPLATQTSGTSATQTSSAPAYTQPVTFRRDEKHDNGKYYLSLQKDGNFVVKTTSGGFVHGFNEIMGPDRFGLIAEVRFQADGNFAAYDDNGGWVWSALDKINPGGKLALQPDGDLWLLNSAGGVEWTFSGKRGAAAP